MKNNGRRQFLQQLTGLAAGMTCTSLWAQTSDFERYRQQYQAEFSSYREQIQQEFAEYQHAVDQAFAAYRQKVRSSWGDEQLGSASVWVEYSQDMKTRTLVDYAQGTLTVEVIEPEASTKVGRRIGSALQQVAEKRVNDALQDDALLQQVEKDVVRISHHSEQGQADSHLMLGDVLTGKNNPRPAEIKQAVNQVVTQGAAVKRPAPEAGMRIYSFSVPLNKTAISSKASTYQPLVLRYAAAERIDPALVMAIIHSESAFNPMARSHVPAFGLMQIVPGSAGLDATEKVYGQQRMLAPSYLYNAENNIKMGCAYIHILYYRYLAAIRNEESRIYCTIAAYNTGSGNVARAFGNYHAPAAAAVQINRMTPQQVYTRLVRHLPYEETRNYMTKVTPRYQAYQQQLG